MPARVRRTARVYGAAHQAERERLRPVVEAGNGWCAEVICLMPTRWIEPGSEWDLCHEPDGVGYRGPGHARCNRSEGARRGNRQRGTGKGSRHWELREQVQPVACPTCGAEFTPKWVGQQYCAKTCRPLPQRVPMSRVYYATCADCGQLFTARAPHAARCPDHRGYRARARTSKPCEDCGDEVVGTAAKRVCSRCARRRERATPAGRARRARERRRYKARLTLRPA